MTNEERRVYRIARKYGYEIHKGNRHICVNGIVSVVKDDEGNPVKGYSICDNRTGMNIIDCQDSNRDNLYSWEDVLTFVDEHCK